MTEYLARVADDAVRAGYSEEEALNMSPRKLAAVYHRSAEIRLRDRNDSAIATRIGSWAKDRDFTKLVKDND